MLNELKVESGTLLNWNAAPGASSFSEARRKLSGKKCKEAFFYLRNQRASRARVAYYGFRLVGGDMTKLAFLWDISTNTPLDWRLERCYASERFAAHDMLDQLDEKDLLILDRGYPSRRLFMDLDSRKIKYLMRISSGKAGSFKEVRQFAQDENAWDRVVMLHEDNRHQGERTIRVRLMKKRLPCGKIGVFATNLLGIRKYRRRALCDLYCYRWDIETAFREMKIWHGLGNFSARYADGIHQEVSALMIYMLMVGEL